MEVVVLEVDVGGIELEVVIELDVVEYEDVVVVVELDLSNDIAAKYPTAAIMMIITTITTI